MPVETRVDQAVRDSIEAAGRNSSGAGAVPGGDMIPASWYWVKTGDLIPPWWSRKRDIEMARLMMSFNHLSGINYAARTKLANIPLRFAARDTTITSHLELADSYTQQLTYVSQFGQGFRVAYKRYIGDYLKSDNGGFMEILGPGEPDGPIVGLPWGVRHLDSTRCTRTRNDIYPVLFFNPDDGKRYKFHYSRVIFMSQESSERETMNGVGFCPLSRSFELGQVLADQLIYKLEKMGSRPQSQLIVGKNMDSTEIVKAFMMAEELMDELGLRRYAKIVALGGMDIEVDKIDLNEFAPFDEETGTVMAIYALAYIWGLDVRDIWPIQGSKSSDQLANMKARGRLPADFTADLKDQLDMKLLPPVLEARFDFQDDEEDQSRALIKDIRARRRERLAKAGLLDRVSEMRSMVGDGDMQRGDFVRWMLSEGYLEDGTSVSVLFHSKDPVIATLVNLNGIEDPLVYEDNDKEDVLREVHVQQSMCLMLMAQSGSRAQNDKAKKALAALDWLEFRYGDVAEEIPEQLIEVSGMEDEEETEAVFENEEDEEDMESDGDDEQEREE